MQERSRPSYRKEEKFLEEFSGFGRLVADAVDNGAYKPRYDCTDADRRQDQYFVESGDMTSWLVFDTAVPFYDEHGQLSSVQVVLKSSNRFLTIRISRDDSNNWIAQKIIEKPAVKGRIV